MNKNAIEYMTKKMAKETDAELERRYGKPPKESLSVKEFAEVLKRAKPVNALIAERMITSKSLESYQWSEVINKVPEIVAVMRGRAADLERWNLDAKKFLDTASLMLQEIVDRAHLEPKATGIGLLGEFVSQLKSIAK